MNKLKSNIFYPNARQAVQAWLIVCIIASALAAYEIAAINFRWWHTISYLSNVHQWLGWVITVAMVSVVGWWVWHFKHNHPWFK